MNRKLYESIRLFAIGFLIICVFIIAAVFHYDPEPGRPKNNYRTVAPDFESKSYDIKITTREVVSMTFPGGIEVDIQYVGDCSEDDK